MDATERALESHIVLVLSDDGGGNPLCRFNDATAVSPRCSIIHVSRWVRTLASHVGRGDAQTLVFLSFQWWVPSKLTWVAYFRTCPTAMSPAVCSTVPASILSRWPRVVDPRGHVPAVWWTQDVDEKGRCVGYRGHGMMTPVIRSCIPIGL